MQYYKIVAEDYSAEYEVGAGEFMRRLQDAFDLWKINHDEKGVVKDTPKVRRVQGAHSIVSENDVAEYRRRMQGAFYALMEFSDKGPYRISCCEVADGIWGNLTDGPLMGYGFSIEFSAANDQNAPWLSLTMATYPTTEMRSTGEPWGWTYYLSDRHRAAVNITHRIPRLTLNDGAVCDLAPWELAGYEAFYSKDLGRYTAGSCSYPLVGTPQAVDHNQSVSRIVSGISLDTANESHPRAVEIIGRLRSLLSARFVLLMVLNDQAD